ncbi:Uma2 family endonuclease [Micromonospora ureilytica]|uniref:Uma2 family endonuclease n=1 Tax=Micromonospora ureilytica TaxID=709868 RepID=A0A3N9XPZ9_9ACTN|nr:Uma2 family endonuclease [Micromonospora ureilytica]RQX15185.1 Uma2 family endonuclease [Micromonospora ureilytica]WSG32574.1 Uma2 family endonuclease [Micromonospora ureilytica]
MTTELETFCTPEGGWTTGDLDRLPDDNRRRELLDGILLMPPPPRTSHQKVTARLTAALDDMSPDGYVAVHGVEVRVSNSRTFVPDGVVLRVTGDDDGHRHWFAPSEVVIAVEVVSKGTETIDRVLKPALYAQAGIPYYWRIETEGALEVVTYRIDAVNEVYTETGRWTKFVDTGEPFPINLPISRITPRVR